MNNNSDIVSYEDRLADPNWNNVITRVQCLCGSRGLFKEVEYNNLEQVTIVGYRFDCPKCKRDYAFESEVFFDKSDNESEMRCYLISTKNKNRRKRVHFKPVLVPYLNRYY